MSVKITDKPTATSMSTADKIFANIGGALKQITKERFLKDTHDKIDQVNSNLSELKYGENRGGKNLLKLNVLSNVINNGITYTPKYDKNGLLLGIHAEGTASASSDSYYTLPKQIILQPGMYSFSGGYSGDALLFYEGANGSNEWFREVVKTLTKESTIRCGIYVPKGKTVNCDFKPMIVETSVFDNKYEPYIPSVAMLTDENEQQNDSLSVLGKCKNLLKSELQSITKNGVTCTANGDGTYTLNGTATAEIDVLIGHTIKTFKKNTKLKIAGMPTTGKAFVYDSFNSLGGQSFAYGFEGKEYQTKSESSHSNCNLHIPSGTSLPNVIIRPMIVENLNATYDDFVPYTGDGDTLTADVAKLNSDLSALIARVTALEGK